MRRIDFPLKPCEVCGATMPRRRFPSGRLERPKRYELRRTCGRMACAKVIQHRTRAEICAFTRGNPDVAHLTAIAAENRLAVAQCSRCDDVFILTLTERERGRRRCDYCRRWGGASHVAYVRGQNRNSEARYEAALRRIS